MTTLDHFKNSKEVVTFEPGDVIFKEGDDGDIMYGIQDGEIDILCDDKVLETVGPGSVIGEMALVGDRTRSATAIAKTSCRLVEVDERRFKFLVHETPTFALNVMGIMADRLRNMNALARDVS